MMPTYGLKSLSGCLGRCWMDDCSLNLKAVSCRVAGWDNSLYVATDSVFQYSVVYIYELILGLNSLAAVGFAFKRL